jgi:long-chain fatty acid transport protein
MRLLATIAGSAILVATCLAHASPEDIFSYGPRSPAMGGTGAATSEGFEAAYTNPALLSRIRRERLTLGYQEATFALYASGDREPGRVSVAPMKGYVIGADLPIPFGGVLRDRVAAGLAFYTPNDVLVRGRILYPETPEFPLLPDRTQSLMVRAGFGVDFGKGLRLGAGFAALAEIAGTVTVATDATGRVGSRVEDQLIATYAPSFGATYDLPFDRDATGKPRWRAGVAFRGTLDARFSVEIDATKLTSLPIPVFNVAGLAQYDPAELAFEIAHERGPWTIAVGLTYKDWSQYPGILEPTILCPDPSTCNALTPPKIPFSDTLVPRLGVDRSFELQRGATAHVRAGAFYEPSPVPSALPSSIVLQPPATQTGTVSAPTRFFDADRLAVTVGAGVDGGAAMPFTLDVYGQVHTLLRRTFTLDVAPDAKVSGHVLMTGLMAGVRF